MARRGASFIICLQHRSHSSPSLFSRGRLVQNLSQSETLQFVFHTDMWHLVTHVNYHYGCYTELFRRLERFRPTKHKHWGCTCLLYSSKHSAQQFSTILAYHTRIILARCITLHVKQAPNLTADVSKKQRCYTMSAKLHFDHSLYTYLNSSSNRPTLRTKTRKIVIKIAYCMVRNLSRKPDTWLFGQKHCSFQRLPPFPRILI